MGYYKKLKPWYEKVNGEAASQQQPIQGEEASEENDMADDNAGASVIHANGTPSQSPSKSLSKLVNQSAKGGPGFNPQTPVKRQKTSTDQDSVGYKLDLHGLLLVDEAFN